MCTCMSFWSVPINQLKILLCSRTSHKRPPKMQTLSGRLREVVVYKNRTTQEVSSKNWSRHIYFTEDNLLHAVRICVVPCCH